MSTGDANQSLDEALRQAVLNALRSDPGTASLDLRVGVLNAVVHLAGIAASAEDWQRAGQIAGRIPGVRGVVNRIEAPGAPSPSRVIHLEFTTNTQRGDQDERQP